METDREEDELLSSDWMRRTGWTEMFLGANRSFLVMLGACMNCIAINDFPAFALGLCHIIHTREH